jgi:hypothetical protein
MMLEALIAALILISIAMAGFGIKMLFKPNETFKKTCGSSFDPATGKPMSCGCGSQAREECESTKLEVKLNDQMPNA